MSNAGNLLLNLFGCGACVKISLESNSETDILLIALAFGLAVFAAVSVIKIAFFLTFSLSLGRPL